MNFSQTQIYAIIDDQHLHDKSPLEIAKIYLEVGIKIIQLRCKNQSQETILEYAKDIQKLKSEFEFLFIINDHIEIAKKIDADGIHVGQDDEDVTKIRKILGDEKIIGLSTHHLDQIKRANQLPINYIGFGPIFSTSSKINPDPEVGLETLEEAVKISTHPLVAIGGIQENHLSSIKILSPWSIALISALSHKGEFEKNSQRLQAQIKSENKDDF